MLKLSSLYKYPYSTLLRGIVAFVLSYYPYLVDPAHRSHFVVLSGAALFYLAVIDTSEFITFKFHGYSLKTEIYKNFRTKRRLFIVGLLGGVLLDGTVQWLGKFWIYPFWSNTFYLLIFVVGFAVYYLTLVESYLAAKTVLDYLIKGRKNIGPPRKFERVLFTVLFIIGCTTFIPGVYILLSNYSSLGGYVFSINTEIVLDSTKSFVGAVLLFMTIFFTTEYWLYRRRAVSVLRTVLHGYFVPVLAVLLSSFIVLALMESQNGPLLLWKYINFPGQETVIFSMPILGLLGWPLHYLAIINVYALVFRKDERLLLGNDTFA
ncbi:MAG: hypothetical protein JNK26_05355 [Candidatus Doudnabacteria bacterium]|nr:hypothetical protein [Candidatus Doudnabacteria bacterium]